MSSNVSTAVVHYEIRSNGGTEQAVVSSALDGVSVESTIADVASKDEIPGMIIDAFLRLWERHPDGRGLLFYTPSAVVRTLIDESIDHFPGLRTVSMTLGEGLSSTWHACRKALNDVWGESDDSSGSSSAEPIPHMLIATDASKSRNRDLAGIAAVTSKGNIHTVTVNVDLINEAEMAAVRFGLQRFGLSAESVEVVTDNRFVYHVLNGDWKARSTKNLASTQRLIQHLRNYGVDVAFRWVPGHSGRLFNEFADRAARVVRQGTEWGQPRKKQQEILDGIREELAEEILAAA